jgi:hypothetical protein
VRLLRSIRGRDLRRPEKRNGARGAVCFQRLTSPHRAGIS